MADVDEPTFTSLADRIAALNQQKNFSVPQSSGPGKRPPPPPPPGGRPTSETNTLSKAPSIPNRPQKEARPALPQRAATSASTSVNSSPALPSRNAPPPLPNRQGSAQSSPALPPRRPSTQTLSVRRGSNASDMSHVSTISNLSLGRAPSYTSTTSTETQASRKLPPALDQAKLPPLPPTRREREAQAAIEAEAQQVEEALKAPLVKIKSAPVIPQSPSQRPSLPPRLPSRPSKPSVTQIEEEEQAPVLPQRRLPPTAPAIVRPKSDLSATRPAAARPQDDTPPPLPGNRPRIPISSRPPVSQISAATKRAPASQVPSCIVCRDFSGPDGVAAQYPAANLPRNDPVGYLANVLCSPFSSETDKARAIFTWCHHNIAYNVEEFFGKCVKGRNVDETIFLGKAVCQGYAEVYQAVARRAGLECVVVGGHGKGYGHVPLTEGQAPPPRNPTGHAWNAVRIDNGEWKLLDACWGAGSVGDQQYHKHFTPEMFCLSNELFGLKHFPSDSRHFYRNDGRIPTWEEYIIGPTKGEKAQWYGTGTEEGVSEFTFSPAEKKISVNSDQYVRFQFSKICEHWDPEKHGKGKAKLMMLKIYGVDGRKEDLVPLESDGFWWWKDIPARDLGAPGQKIFLYALKTLNNKDARGVTREDYYRETSGGYSLSWDIYVQWDLV